MLHRDEVHERLQLQPDDGNEGAYSDGGCAGNTDHDEHGGADGVADAYNAGDDPWRR